MAAVPKEGRVRLRPASLALLASAALLAVACQSQVPSHALQTHYQLKGTVVSANPEAKQIVVDGEEIPGLMDAMTMPYTVKNAQMLEGISSGDQITADVVVEGDQTWLESIVVIKKEAAPATPAAAAFHMPQPGEVVPDFSVTNQDGRQVRLQDYRGKSVLLTFIYTSCPQPNFCPLMTRNFAQIEKRLADDRQVYRKTHLLSISFDTEHDTPEVLRKYAASQVSRGKAINFRHWEFASLPAGQRQEVAHFFALTYSEQQGQIIHSLSTAIISPDGRLYRWYHGNDWQPSTVLRELKKSSEEDTSPGTATN